MSDNDDAFATACQILQCRLELAESRIRQLEAALERERRCRAADALRQGARLDSVLHRAHESEVTSLKRRVAELESSLTTGDNLYFDYVKRIGLTPTRRPGFDDDDDDEDFSDTSVNDGSPPTKRHGTPVAGSLPPLEPTDAKRRR